MNYGAYLPAWDPADQLVRSVPAVPRASCVGPRSVARLKVDWLPGLAVVSATRSSWRNLVLSLPFAHCFDLSPILCSSRCHANHQAYVDHHCHVVCQHLQGTAAQRAVFSVRDSASPIRVELGRLAVVDFNMCDMSVPLTPGWALCPFRYARVVMLTVSVANSQWFAPSRFVFIRSGQAS